MILNAQNSSWAHVKPRAFQGSILGPLLFLMRDNDVSDNLLSNPMLDVEDTSIFLIVNSKHSSTNILE